MKVFIVVVTLLCVVASDTSRRLRSAEVSDQSMLISSAMGSHKNCKCSGHKNGRGQGSICGYFGARKSWCYVQPTCPTAVSSKYSGLSWAFCTVPAKPSLYAQAAGGPGGTGPDSVSGVVHPQHVSVRANPCTCRGHENSKGQGGRCGFFGAKRSWCYVSKYCTSAHVSVQDGLRWAYCRLTKSEFMGDAMARRAGPIGCVACNFVSSGHKICVGDGLLCHPFPCPSGFTECK